MLLKKKNAVIYGAGGAIGSAVARAFARQGATPSSRNQFDRNDSSLPTLSGFATTLLLPGTLAVG